MASAELRASQQRSNLALCYTVKKNLEQSIYFKCDVKTEKLTYVTIWYATLSILVEHEQVAPEKGRGKLRKMGMLCLFVLQVDVVRDHSNKQQCDDDCWMCPKVGHVAAVGFPVSREVVDGQTALTVKSGEIEMGVQLPTDNIKTQVLCRNEHYQVAVAFRLGYEVYEPLSYQRM